MASSAFSNRNFLIYLCGSVISLHGLWIYRVALGWYAWQLSGSELWVGIVAFTQFAPAVVLGPLFGVLADRFDRRKASILINTAGMLVMLVLSALTFLGKVDITILATFSLLQGVLDGAHTPVRMTIVPGIVSREQLSSAVAGNSIAFNVSRFVGPAIAGFIILNWGVGAAFAANSVSYLGIVGAVIVVQLNPGSGPSKQRGDVWSELLHGVRYVIHHRTIFSVLITVAITAVFARGALEMLPAFADAIFAGGSSALAILTSAIGGGSIVTGLVLSRYSDWLTADRVRAGVIAAGLLIVAFGASDQFWLAVPIVTILGVILSLIGVGSQVLIQSLVDEEVRGRVSSLWGMITFGGTALGSLVVGLGAAMFGLQTTVMVTGLLCATIASLSRSHAS